jgi:hypothetical protein
VGDSLEVVVSNQGRAPMPVHLVVTRSEGEPQTVEIPVSVWFTGEKLTSVRIAREPTIKTIEIDPKRQFPDLDRSNGIWPR